MLAGRVKGQTKDNVKSEADFEGNPDAMPLDSEEDESDQREVDGDNRCWRGLQKKMSEKRLERDRR